MSTQNPQYMVKKLVPQWKFFKQTSPEKYGTGPVGLLKNLWGEVSVMLFNCIVSVVIICVPSPRRPRAETINNADIYPSDDR